MLSICPEASASFFSPSGWTHQVCACVVAWFGKSPPCPLSTNAAWMQFLRKKRFDANKMATQRRWWVTVSQSQSSQECQKARRVLRKSHNESENMKLCILPDKHNICGHASVFVRHCKYSNVSIWMGLTTQNIMNKIFLCPQCRFISCKSKKKASWIFFALISVKCHCTLDMMVMFLFSRILLICFFFFCAKTSLVLLRQLLIVLQKMQFGASFLCFKLL